MLEYLSRIAAVSALALVLTATVSAQDDPRQKAVLVTGASSGIGLKITERLSGSGAFVYAGARKPDDIERLDRMENVQALRLDVTSDEDIARALETVRREGRGLHGIVNNAGVANVGPLIEQPEEDVRFLFDVNVFGPYRITQAFAPMLIEEQGRIVNISSISGVLSGKFFGAYSMSKHAVEAYSDSLAREMAPFGVHVAAVAPGNYSSDIGRNMLARMNARGYDVGSSRYAGELQRMLAGFEGYDEPGESNPEPDDVAAAVEDALFGETPKEHYMVVPYERQAEITLRKLIEELVRFNEDHEYSLQRDALIRLLDEELARGRPNDD